VTTSSTIEVKRVLYSVPSRLIGERLRLHIFDDRIEGFLGSTRAVTLRRLYARSPERARLIDYRHLIAALVRKPQAFRFSQLRDDLLPTPAYHAIWRHLDGHLEARAACKRIVGILALAVRGDCEQALGAYLLEQIEAKKIPELHALEQRFEPTRQGPDRAAGGAAGAQHPLGLYDSLLPSYSRPLEAH
jgi:hypothetical protein